MECLAVCSRPQHGRVSNPLAGPKHRPQMIEVFSALGMYVEPASWLTHAKSRGERNDALWSLPGMLRRNLAISAYRRQRAWRRANRAFSRSKMLAKNLGSFLTIIALCGVLSFIAYIAHRD